MKRHNALQDLSRDHHHFLLQSRQIGWYMKGDHRAPSFSRVLYEFLYTWEHEIIPHLEEEEELLLPHYAAYPSQKQTDYQKQILNDHEWLRGQVVELRRHTATELESGVADEPDVELLELLGEIGQRLHDHVRFEERLVFQHLQQVMPADALAQIRDASLAFRQTKRPDAIGPREEVCIIIPTVDS